MVGARPGRRAIFSRSKHQQVLTGAKRDRRKHPFPPALRIIGQRPAQEVHAGRTPVEQLDPVARIAIFIDQPIEVIRHDLIEHHIGGQTGAETVGPATARKRIGNRRGVLDPVSSRPTHRNRAVSGLAEGEKVWPDSGASDRNCRLPVDDEVGGVHTEDGLIERDLNLGQDAQGSSRRREYRQDDRRKRIDQRIRPRRARTQFVESVPRQVIDPMTGIPGALD